MFVFVKYSLSYYLILIRDHTRYIITLFILLTMQIHFGNFFVHNFPLHGLHRVKP